MPDGEEWAGTNHLLPALSERGIDGRWVVWDDPAVDWSESLVAVRATWDYEQRREEFLAWARSLPRMLNSAAVFEWNTDKAYLTQLADAGVPVVPTVVVERSEDLLGAVAGFGHAVVKPCVGAGGRGVVVLDGSSQDGARLRHRPLGGAAAGRVGAHRGRDLGLRPRRRGRLPGAEAPGSRRAPRARAVRRYDGRDAGHRRGGRARPDVRSPPPRRSSGSGSTTPASTRCGWPTAPSRSASSR